MLLRVKTHDHSMDYSPCFCDILSLTPVIGHGPWRWTPGWGRVLQCGLGCSLVGDMYRVSGEMHGDVGSGEGTDATGLFSFSLEPTLEDM